MNITKYRSTILYGIIVVFFTLMGVLGPIGIYNDTSGYLNHSSARDPLYAIFMWLTSFMNETCRMRVIVILQNVFMAFSYIFLLSYLTQCFRMKTIMQVLVTGCLLVPHILIPLATKSGMILMNSILSEGITLPLYVVFFTFILKMLFSDDKKVYYGLLSLIFCILLITARGQLMSVLIVWVLVAIYCCIKKKRFWWIPISIILFIGAFFAKLLVNNIYNYLANGVATGNTSEAYTILANTLFWMDLDQKVVYEDKEIQAVYDEIIVNLSDVKLNYKYAPNNLDDFVTYYEYCHDEIKFNEIYTVIPIHYYVRRNGFTDSITTAIECDKTAKIIYSKLLLSNPKNYFSTYTKLATAGMIRTVAILSPLFDIYAIGIYTLFIFVSLCLFLRYRKADVVIKSVELAVFLMILILGLVLSTSFVTACISRYVIYNMSLFYIVLLILIQTLIRQKRNIQYGEEE